DKFRGGDGTHICRDVEQTEFNGGMPVPKTFKAGTPDEYQAEGWVRETTIWPPGTKVKFCACDAKAKEEVNGTQCDSEEGAGERGCGCGPNLRFCYGPAVANEGR